MTWWADGTGYGGWAAMALAMVALWALVFLGLAALLRGAGPSSGAARPPRGAAEERALDERFARGEISAEAYRASRARLRRTL